MSVNLKFSLNETLESVQMDIIAVLPELKLDWEFNDSDKEKPYFATEVNGILLRIYQSEVHFKIVRGGLGNQSRVFRRVVNKKPQKVKMFDVLMKRFSDDNDFVFYKRVLRFMNGHLTAQKKRSDNHGLEFTEEYDSREDT